MMTNLKKFVLRHCPDALLIPMKKAHYARLLQNEQYCHEKDFDIVRLLVKPGDHVVDIGANIGVYAKLLSGLTGPEGSVVSVEPIPLTYDILCSNIHRLRLDNVHPVNCAISEENGEVCMEVPAENQGIENFYEAHIVSKTQSENKGFRHFCVAARTVDSLLSDGSGPIAFIKCDVEGHELSAIRSAGETIRRDHPAWMIEVTSDLDQPTSKAGQMAQLMAEEGYGIYWYDGEKLQRRAAGEQSANCFFLTEKHAVNLIAKGALAAPPRMSL